MKSFQQRCLDAIEEKAAALRLDCTQVSNFANTGSVLVHFHGGSAKVIGRIDYSFDAGYYRLKIYVDEKPVLSQPPREGYFDFYQANDAPTKFWDALAEALVRMKRESMKKWGKKDVAEV